MMSDLAGKTLSLIFGVISILIAVGLLLFCKCRGCI
jgi:hypothetical protein